MRALSVEIGPRPACSREEQRAAEWCAARLSEHGYRVEIEEFRSRTNYALWYVTYFSLALVGALLIVPLPFVALAFGFAALVLYARDSEGRPLVSARGGTSRNVVARPPADGAPEVVVMAHLDSARSSPSFHPRFVAGFRTSTTILNLVLIAVPVLGAATWVYEVDREPPVAMWIPAGLLAAYLLFAIGLLSYGHFRMPLVAGANDNATGVEVALRLAESGAQPGVWYAILGSEEVGMVGAQAFYERHVHELSETRFVNIDNVGAGTLLAVTAEGVLRELRSDGYMIDLAEEAGAEGRPFRGLPTDATVVLARRRKALTLLAVNEHGVPANWHWPTDVIENVDGDVVDRATAAAKHVVDSLLTEKAPT